jgi:nucleotide-binding universal stress UspA family protein
MKRILVPTDFSIASKASLKFAVALATQSNAEIYVLHVNEVPLLVETTFGIQPLSPDAEALQKVAITANRAFDSMKKELPCDIPIIFKTINDTVVSGIREYIDENDIDLVIMSTRGTSDMDDFFVGSTAEKIVRLSPVPVMSIPKETTFEGIKNIVFPSVLDFDQDDLIVRLKELQQLFGAKLHVLLINTPEHFYSDQQAKDRLERFARHYELSNFTLNFRCHQSERGGILEFLNEAHGDMIAMATHGRTGFMHIVKGSIAEDVLNRIDQPIWTWNITKEPQPNR